MGNQPDAMPRLVFVGLMPSAKISSMIIIIFFYYLIKNLFFCKIFVSYVFTRLIAMYFLNNSFYKGVIQNLFLLKKQKIYIYTMQFKTSKLMCL